MRPANTGVLFKLFIFLSLANVQREGQSGPCQGMGLPNVITFLARELVLRDVKANPAVVSVTPYQVRIKKLKKKKSQH